MSLPGAKIINGALCLLAAGLALALGYVTDWGERVSNPRVATSERTITPSPGGMDVLPDFRLSGDASSYNTVQQRPLLNPTRAPAPTAPVVVMTEPPKPQIRRGLYELLGVSEIGSARTAQLRENATRRVVTVRQGDSLQELKVESIANERVILGFQGEKDEIQLARFTASSRVPQPPPPPTPIAPPPVSAQTANVPPQMANAPTVAGAQQSVPPTVAATPTLRDAQELRRLEAIATQNPSNWNRSRIDQARRRLEQQGTPPNN